MAAVVDKTSLNHLRSIIIRCYIESAVEATSLTLYRVVVTVCTIS